LPENKRPQPPLGEDGGVVGLGGRELGVPCPEVFGELGGVVPVEVFDGSPPTEPGVLDGVAGGW
jgi:hypothetical protein